MKELGFLEKIEPHLNRVGVSYRSKATIEPYLSKQWFVRMDGFARKMRAAVEEGHTKLIPKHWESTYFHWILTTCATGASVVSYGGVTASPFGITNTIPIR